MENTLSPRTILAPSPAGEGAITRARVHGRTRELAFRAGRDATQVTHADYEQARREVTGESERERQEAKLDGLPGPAGFTP